MMPWTKGKTHKKARGTGDFRSPVLEQCKGICTHMLFINAHQISPDKDAL